MLVPKNTPSRLPRSHRIATLLVVLALALATPLLQSCDQEPTAAPPSKTTSGQLPAWLKVYFTNPDPPDAVENGIDQVVVPVLAAAKQSIDVASFDLNLPSVVNALADAARRGVTVRVVVDGENGDQELDAKQSPTGKAFKALSVLKSAGIKVVDGGRSNGLMHDKIIIVDGKALFVGSWNMSYNDTFRNNNNLLQISARDLVANYQAKFDELYVDKNFGTHAEVGALKPALTIDGVKVENAFSPTDDVMDKLVKYVQGAKHSVHFIIFTYTHADLADAMIQRAKAGVDVQGVIENRGASQGAMVPLFCAKLPVKVDGNKYTMHHKVIILDGDTVVTGSFNFTQSADNANDDNIIVIHSAALAALYEQEYQRVSGAAKSPDAADVDCSKVR
jgi:phosphatidylserine/phosphatidylglycerophosphate/cardiolipin synthase-like enzyme